MITLSTNGSLLTNPNISRIISTYPPYRLTVSLYGATSKSYESLTQTCGSFDKFLRGLKWAKENNIKTRLNIIVTEYNKKEIEPMIEMANKSGFEYHIFPKLSPTLDGDVHPFQIMAEECNFDIKKKPVANRIPGSECLAGKTFFHVNSEGKASICKIAREPNIDLIKEGVKGLYRLSGIAEQLLKPIFPCGQCELKDSCVTCFPKLNLYKKSKIIPSYICNNNKSEVIQKWKNM